MQPVAPTPVHRSRAPLPPSQPPAPPVERKPHKVWPNGSGIYALLGAGIPEKQLGWMVPSGKEYEVFERTGPGNGDFVRRGTAKDYPEARALLPTLPWGDRRPSGKRARKEPA